MIFEGNFTFKIFKIKLPNNYQRKKARRRSKTKMLNKAILMGRLARDPELRYTTTSNIPVTSFTIAVERNRSSKDTDKVTDFIDCVAWRKTAEFVSQWFTKGQMIVVVGSIQTRKWTDKNGNNRVSVEILTDEVQFGESKKSREFNAGGYQPNYPAPQQNSGYAAPQNTDGFTEINDDDGDVPF